MSAAEVLAALAAIEERARTYSGLGFEHEGDCAGSLCTSCGHCLHTVDADGCKCADCGCIDAVDDDEVLMKRDALRMATALRAVLDTCQRALTIEGRPCVDIVRVRADIATALTP